MEENAQKILKHLQRTPLKIDVILLQQEVSVEELMTLSPGGIMIFDHSVKEAACLSVNQKKFAKGTVVQAGERYALRIEEIMSELN